MTGGSTICPLPDAAATSLRPRLERFQKSLDLLERIRQRQHPGLLAAELEPLQRASVTRQLGRFRLLGRLGSGGHGVVFRARDPVLNREVALKVPRPEMLLVADLRERFLREARAAAGLDHPHIVPLYEVGEVGTLTFLAYAYVPGPNLAEWLQRQTQPMPWRQAVALVADLAAAVEYLHGRGILHRDIKPGNVLLQPRSDDPTAWVPRLTDFGLARLTDEGTRLTQTGTLLGTPAYMAPEQAAGQNQEIGPGTDIFALGCILHELLTRKTPYHAPSDFNVLQLLATEDVSSFRSQVPGMPRDVETVCLKCLARMPKDRYATAADLEADLRAVLDGRSIQARPQRWPERLWRQARRRPRMTLTLALVLAALAAVTTWGEIRSQRHTRIARTREQLDYLRRIPDTQRLLDQGDGVTALEQLNALRPAAGAVDLRNFEWRLLWERCRRDGLRLRIEPGAHVQATAYTPDGQSILTGDSKGCLNLWNARTGELHWKQVTTAALRSLTFSPDGQLILNGDAKGKLQIRAAREGRLLDEFTQHPERGLTGLAVTPDGRGVYSVGEDGYLRYLDRAARATREDQRPERLGLFDLTRAPDGRTLLSSDLHNVYLFESETLRPLRTSWLQCSMQHLAFQPEGRLAIVGGEDGLALLECTSLEPRSFLAVGRQNIRAVRPRPGTSDIAVALQPNEKATGQIELLDGAALLAATPTALREAGQRVTTFGKLTIRPNMGQGIFSALAAGRGDDVFVTANATAGPARAETPEQQPNPGMEHALVLGTGLSGRERYVLPFGGTGHHVLQAAAIGPDRRVTVVGSFAAGFDIQTLESGKEQLTARGKYDLFVARLEPATNQIRWLRSAGGPGHDQALGVAVDEHGNTYVTGFCERSCRFPGVEKGAPADGPSRCACVWKLLPDGRTGWVRFLPSWSASQTVAVTSGTERAIFVGGWQREEDGALRSLLWKLNDAGETQAVQVAARTAGQEEILRLAHDTAGNLLIAGMFRGTVDLQALGGGPRLQSSTKQPTAFVMKQDQQGRCLWTRVLPRVGASCRVAAGPGGSIYLGGDFRGRLDLPGGGSLTSAHEGPHGFCALLDADGHTVWNWALDGAGTSQIDAMAVDAGGQVRLAGSFTGQLEARLGLDQIVEGRVGAGRRVFLAQIRPVIRVAPPLAFPVPIKSLAWSPDGTTFAVGGQEGLGGLWSCEQRPVELSTAPEEAWCVAFSPDGQKVAVGCDTEKSRNGLRLYEVATGRVLWQAADHEKLVTAVAFTPDGATLASGSFDGVVRLSYPATGRQRACLLGHTAAVRCLAISPDGRLLASAGKDKVIHVYDLATLQLRTTLEGHEQQIMALVFAPDNRTLLSTSTDCSVRCWDTSSGKCVQLLSDVSAFWGLTCSPDGRLLAAGTHQGRIRLLDRVAGNERTLAAHPSAIRALLFTTDGQRLFSAGQEGVIKIWDVATGQHLLTLKGHEREIHGLALAPDGTVLASAGLDGTVRLWRAPVVK